MKIKMTVTYYNNDIGTAFIMFVHWFCTVYLAEMVLNILVEKDILKKKPIPDMSIAIFTAILCAIFYKYTDSYRLFKTEYLVDDVIIKQTFSHDSRQVISYLNLENKRVENYHTGSITQYATSSNGDLFTVMKRTVPTFLATVAPGDKIKIHAWKFFNFGNLYEIYGITKS
jgi:hypothetical protein